MIAPLSDNQLLANWGPPCRRELLTRYTFGDGYALIRPEMFSPLVLLSRILRRHGLKPRANDTWSYACRPIRTTRGNTRKWSMHSLGIAVDVRATSYPLGVRVTDPALLAAAAEVEALLCPDGARMWSWGGRWRRPDGMHWQAGCGPASAAQVTF